MVYLIQNVNGPTDYDVVDTETNLVSKSTMSIERLIEAYKETVELERLVAKEQVIKDIINNNDGYDALVFDYPYLRYHDSNHSYEDGDLTIEVEGKVILEFNTREEFLNLPNSHPELFI
jgi:SAM-dependent MidA family methyltransferase